MAEQERQPIPLDIVPTGPRPRPPTDRADEPDGAESAEAPEVSFYEAVGGRETFARLVHAFYQGIAQDEVLRPMYPEEDLGPAEERLLMFLEQYWGGPTTYSQQRGHPRLRMRHVPFRVNSLARDHWLKHMRAAVTELQLPPAYESMLWDYLERAAFSLQNTPD